MQNWHWLDIEAVYIELFFFVPPFVCAFRVCLCVRAVEMWQSWLRSFLRLRLELNGTTFPVLIWFIPLFTLQAQRRISRSDPAALTTNRVRKSNSSSSSSTVTDAQQQSGRQCRKGLQCVQAQQNMIKLPVAPLKPQTGLKGACLQDGLFHLTCRYCYLKSHCCAKNLIASSQTHLYL